MVFNSAVFIYFAVIVISLYWLLGRWKRGLRLQNLWLLAASYFFYGYWDWMFLSLIVASTVTDFTAAILIEKLDPGTHQKLRRVVLGFSIIINLGLLGIFKYYDFFIHSFVDMVHSFLPGAFPDEGESLLLHVILPVGISFYTFQTMSYTIDVYRRVIPAEKKFFDFALFVCYFPQLVAGPIERAGDLLSQLKKPRIFNADQFRDGLWLILLGFFYKVYVADNLSPLVDRVYLPGPALYHSYPAFAVGHGGLQVILASIAFLFQIYGDFAGYSFIAMGTSLLMGVRLTQNFDAPEFARSPADLWTRWHVTLGRWIRDYVYIPLGGSRNGAFRHYLNLFITFVLMGFWHGANWTFILWGVYHGFWIVVSRLWSDYFPSVKSYKSLYIRSILSVSGIVFTFMLLALSSTFFRAYDAHHTYELWKSILSFPYEVTRGVKGVPAAPVYAGEILKRVVIMLIVDFALFRTKDLYWIHKQPVWIRTALYSAMFLLITVFGVFGKDVIYFAF